MNVEDPIRVLIVDDTITYRKIVSDVLADLPGVEVVGTAANGKIALQKIEQLRPDLLTLDLEMPEMDGLDVLRCLNQSGSNVQAIMLSGANTNGANLTMTALKLGAFDFVLKPANDKVEKNVEFLRHELGLKIQAFARSQRVHTILHGPAPAPPHTLTAPHPHKDVAHVPHAQRPFEINACKPEVVALGISTGGPASLTRMLPQLPVNLGVPILIVQHMPPVFTKSLADDLNRRCALRVCEACDGQPLSPGNVLIAPGGKQMKVERADGHVAVHITDDPPENSCKPSVDYLFRSVSEIYGKKAVGVIMTGMGNDGARGCQEMKRQGAAIIAQDEATCVIFGMPKGPIEEGIADIVAPLDNIALEILRLVGKGAYACK
ncbi:MAG: chemotaxis response regulator protein-glutamate methylesterase [Thermoguttaceae bacterium]|jgi:two-component system chemotaxis response regulator CheB